MQFNKHTGSQKIVTPLFLSLLFIGLAFAAYLISKVDVVTSLFIVFLPFIIGYIFLSIKNPSLNIITFVILSFVIPGISRYITTEAKLGLIIDVLLIFSYIAILINGKELRARFKLIKIDLLIISTIWMVYNIIELFNPYTAYYQAWFYAVRPIAIYLLLALPLASMLSVSNKYFTIVTLLWGILSILGTIKGALQLIIGLDTYEQIWFNSVGYLTHFVNNRLRVFSFYTDAGQFGAAQGHAAVVGIILATAANKKSLRIFYLLMGVSGLYGMIISGTRGAVFVPYTAALAYVILRKNIRAALLVLFLSATAFVFLKYTYIGSSNYFIHRMRTAFDPEDASLQTRLSNQRLFKEYLKDKPFGGGIGSAGYWGQRFAPGSPLARIATDSWYVQIWAETGIIGLSLYILMLLYIMGKSSYLILFKLKNQQVIKKMIALLAGLAGVAVASYGNNVIGQLPTSFLCYFSIAFLFGSLELDNEMQQKENLIVNDAN